MLQNTDSERRLTRAVRDERAGLRMRDGAGSRALGLPVAPKRHAAAATCSGAPGEIHLLTHVVY